MAEGSKRNQIFNNNNNNSAVSRATKTESLSTVGRESPSKIPSLNTSSIQRHIIQTRLIQKPAPIMLNVGGMILTLKSEFLANISALFPHSYFAKLAALSPQELAQLKGSNEWIFLDRNPFLFQILIIFLQQSIFDLDPCSSSGPTTPHSLSSSSTASSTASSVQVTPRGDPYDNFISVTPKTHLGTEEPSARITRAYQEDNRLLDLQSRWNSMTDQLSLLQKFRLETEIEFFGIDLLTWVGFSSTPLATSGDSLLSVSSSYVIPLAVVNHPVQQRFRPVEYRGSSLGNFSQYYLESDVVLQDYHNEIGRVRGTMASSMLLVAGICSETPSFVLINGIVVSDLTTPYWLDDPHSSLIDALMTFRDVANGLSVLMRTNLSHLHLHPGNVLFRRSPTSETLIPSIGYFGKTSHVSPDEKAFMAPEVIKGSKGSWHSDVFSWGMCVVATLFPKVFKESKKSIAQMKQVLKSQDKIPAPAICSGHNPPFLERFKGFLLQCLDETPEKRPIFSNILSVLQDLITIYPLHKEDSVKFWKKISGNSESTKVKDVDFFSHFFTYLPPEQSSLERATAEKCLRALMGDPFEEKGSSNNKMYDIIDFGRLMDTFGPMDFEFYDRLKDRFMSPGFFAVCNRKYAETALSDSDTYLIRISSTEWGTRGSYVYSIRDNSSKKELSFKHKRFLWSVTHRCFFYHEKSEAKTLEEYIQAVGEFDSLTPVSSPFEEYIE